MMFSTDMLHSVPGRGKARGVPGSTSPRCWLRPTPVGVMARVGRRASKLGCTTTLRGADSTPRPGGLGPAPGLTREGVVTICMSPAGEGVQLGGGQVDQPGRVVGQHGPL